MPATAPVWDPHQYLRHSGHRARAFVDLLAHVPELPAELPAGRPRIADLGCGPGNVTRLLAAPPGSERQLCSYCVGVLGMTEIPKPAVLAARGGCWFQAGEVQLHLGIESDFRAPKKAHPGLPVRDIEAYADRLAAHGTPVTWDDDLPGHRRFTSEDPVGNRLEFLEPSG